MSDYIIIEAESRSELAVLVNEALAIGYVPVGGVFAHFYGSHSVKNDYFQAVAKPATNPTSEEAER